MNNHFPCVLTIAGTDPSGGAGIQADIKTISATGCYAASVITAVVAQNTQGVQSIFEITPEFVVKQLNSVFNDLEIRAIKIGMLHNANIIEAVTHALAELGIINIVLDPVMFAKNGCELLSPTLTHSLKELFPLIKLLTPNLPEAEIILGKEIKSATDMQFAANYIGEKYDMNVLLKGGHLLTEQSSDVLYNKENKSLEWFHSERIQTKNTHGTGCTLSSAIASFLAQDYSLTNAVASAKKYLTQSIKAGSELNIGQGNGPVSHFYFLEGNHHGL